MTVKVSDKALDNVIEDMIQVVTTGKEEIFNITVEARKENEYLQKELLETKKQVHSYIEIGDNLEKKVKASRQQLANVNKFFNKYSEEEIRKVYDTTWKLQTELAVIKQKEKTLRQRRDELERRLHSLAYTIERAENLVSKVSVILSFLEDDFKQVNEIVEDAKEKQAFGLKIIEAQEEERRKLSRDIHDGPAQMLANVLLRTDILDHVAKKGSFEQISSEIKSLRKNVRASLDEVRRIIYDLRPMALDDLGVIPTIRKYVDRISEEQDIHIEFIVLGEEKRLNSKYEVALFRLMQEAAQNALKHSAATIIKVKLEVGKSQLILIVNDNGKGFDITERRENSFGLIGMKERVEMLDGKLSIRTGEGKGTTITINVPYSSS